MDSSVAARGLCETLRIFNIKMQEQFTRQIDFESKTASEDPQLVAERMIDQWKKYQEACKADRLQWRYGGPASFFSSGMWADESLWPWQRVVPRPEASLGVNKIESTASLQEVNQLRQKMKLPPLESL